VKFELKVGETQEKKLGAFCMNLSCSCAAGEPMALTALLCEDKEMLQSQGKVWDHFEGLFAQYKKEAGFDEAPKKAGKGKKKK